MEAAHYTGVGFSRQMKFFVCAGDGLIFNGIMLAGQNRGSLKLCKVCKVCKVCKGWAERDF